MRKSAVKSAQICETKHYTMKHYFFLLLPAFFLLLGCPTGQLGPIATGTLEINFMPYWNGTPLEFGVPLSAGLGRSITLDSFQFYITNVRAIKTDNSEEKIGDIALFDFLKTGKTDHGGGVFAFFSLKVGEYKGLIFDIGVSPTLNHTNAATYDVDSPLYSAKNMFWNEIDGYTFLFLKGKTDSTGTQFPVSYRIGLDDLLTNLTYTSDAKDAFSIQKNKETQYMFQIDVRKIIEGIEVAKQPIIDSRPKNSAEYILSQQIMNNLKTTSLFKEP